MRGRPVADSQVDFPLPTSADPAGLHRWAWQLRDNLLKLSQQQLARSTNQSSEVEALQAGIDALKKQIDELARLIDDFDAEALHDQIVFVQSLQTDLQALFNTARGNLDEALETSRRTARSLTHQGILGLGNTAMIRVEQQTRLESDRAFARQIETIGARVGTAEGLIANERTVRIENDEAMAEDILTLFARVGQTQAGIDEQRTVTASLSSAVAEQLTTIRSAIGGQETSITQLFTSVDGISARATTAINSNGQVIGMIDLAGNALGSQFTVVADRFLIANPTDAGQVKNVCVVGAINGVTTFGLSGDMHLDGQIQARALAVSSLSAITANLGVVTAGVIKSANNKIKFDLNAGTFEMSDVPL